MIAYFTYHLYYLKGKERKEMTNMALTEKGLNALNQARKHFPKGSFSAKDLSEAYKAFYKAILKRFK